MDNDRGVPGHHVTEIGQLGGDMTEEWSEKSACPPQNHTGKGKGTASPLSMEWATASKERPRSSWPASTPSHAE